MQQEAVLQDAGDGEATAGRQEGEGRGDPAGGHTSNSTLKHTAAQQQLHTPVPGPAVPDTRKEHVRLLDTGRGYWLTKPIWEGLVGKYASTSFNCSTPVPVHLMFVVDGAQQERRVTSQLLWLGKKYPLLRKGIIKLWAGKLVVGWSRQQASQDQGSTAGPVEGNATHQPAAGEPLKLIMHMVTMTKTQPQSTQPAAPCTAMDTNTGMEADGGAPALQGCQLASGAAASPVIPLPLPHVSSQAAAGTQQDSRKRPAQAAGAVGASTAKGTAGSVIDGAPELPHNVETAGKRPRSEAAPEADAAAEPSPSVYDPWGSPCCTAAGRSTA